MSAPLVLPPDLIAEIVDFMRRKGCNAPEAARVYRNRGHVQLSAGAVYKFAKDAGLFAERQRAGGHKALALQILADEAAAKDAAKAEKDRSRLEAIEAREARKRSAVTPAAEMPIDARERLRGTVRKLLTFLDSDAWLVEPKRAADAARALDILLGRCPDILTFDEKTNGSVANASDEGREAEAARVSDALGEDEDGGSEDG